MRYWLQIASVVALVAVVVVVASAPGLAGTAETDGTDNDPLAGLDTPVLLNFERTELQKVFTAIGRATGLEVVFENVDPELRISIDTKEQPLKDALKALAKTYHLEYEMPEPGKLLVRGTDKDLPSVR